MSKFSIGSLNQLGDALENTGWTAEDVTKLKQFKNLAGIKDLVNGRAEIKILEPFKWREEDGVIYFDVVSDGTTGNEWINRLENKGFYLSEDAKSLLSSADFKPTSGIKMEIAVLKGYLFSDFRRPSEVRETAAILLFSLPNAEVACLIREMFTDEEIKAMGLLWIITMHDPIKHPEGSFELLVTSGCNNLDCTGADSHHDWNRDCGFAFVNSFFR